MNRGPVPPWTTATVREQQAKIERLERLLKAVSDGDIADEGENVYYVLVNKDVLEEIWSIYETKH